MPPPLLFFARDALVGEPRKIVQAGRVKVRTAANYLQRTVEHSALIVGIGAAAGLQQRRYFPLCQTAVHPQFPDARQKFLTKHATKFAEKTCAWAYVNRPQMSSSFQKRF